MGRKRKTPAESGNMDPTPPPETPQKEHKGRTKGTPNYKTPLAIARRNYSYSIMERIRERVDPDIPVDFQWMIMQGKTPVLEQQDDGSWKVIPDPNPLCPTPTLEQRDRACRWLVDRRDGATPQSVQIDAMIRARVEDNASGITNEQLQGLKPEHLMMLKKIFRPDTDDYIDAEFRELPAGELQEPDQTPELKDE